MIPLKSYLVFSLLTILALLATAAAATPDRQILPRNIEPLHYDLAIEPNAVTATFSGTARIDIDVREATASLMLNAADLEFTQVSVAGVSASPAITLDKTQETATFRFAAPLTPGRHTLTVVYRGKINTSPAGLFSLDAAAADGSRKRSLFTQFENSDARRFMPCWDEPDRKATFTLTATVPATDLAVSNMPIAASRELRQGRKRVTFATTPKMSSYLLFFATGDFERVTRTVQGVEIGVIVRRGDLDKTRFALDAAAQLLAYYNDYFGIRYPLPKLDLIAAPGSSSYFSAMENWGAIFLFDSTLLIDDRLATETDRVNVYTGVAHEMAHQWFGDLVTMQWWDDLWLNEGFATWMENKASNHFHPEWDLWLSSALDYRDAAMRRDSREGTHPVIQPIRDVLQADQAFDTITYGKGMSVVLMLENYLGEDVFRRGVHDYLQTHAYGNAVTDDLWSALDAASHRPVSKIARDFTLQAGVPLIKVERSPQGAVLTQDRFLSGAAETGATVWDVPVTERPLAGGPLWRGLVRHGQSQSLSLTAGALPIVNFGQPGYFRTLYAPDLFAGLSSRFGELAPVDQLGVFYDTTALALVGDEPLPDILKLAAHLRPETKPAVARAIVSQLGVLDLFYRDLPGRTDYDTYARGLLRPLLASLGWNESPRDAGGVPQLRGRLLTTLGQLDDPEVIANARSLFGDYLRNPASLSGETRIAVLGIVALHADAASWEQLHQLALHAKVPTESERYFNLLGAAQDRALAQRALNLTLTNEDAITFRPEIISAVARNYPQLAFDFAVAHLPQIYAAVEPDNRVPYMVDLLTTADNDAATDSLRAFTNAHIPPNARGLVQVHLGQIAYNAKVRMDDLPVLDGWLHTVH